MERNIGFKERRYIEELRILTKSTANDCVIDDRFDRVIYVIRPGDMGLAIGKKGDNIKRLQNVLGKRIEMVEYADNIEIFIANIFKPAEVVGIERGPDNGPVNVLSDSEVTLELQSERPAAILRRRALSAAGFLGLKWAKCFSQWRQHERQS